jgi:calcium-dependent protein kinase
MRSEIHNMKYLDHPHIAKVYEAFEKKRMVWMVMENLSGGDLRSRMPYTEAEVADAIRDVLSAVVYLHSKNVVHRDLKLENIMFEDDSPNASVKLIDFGLSTKYLSNEYKYMRERVGTVYTMSPQVIQGRYDKSCDLWSVGVITYMLLSGGELPFPGKNRAQIVKMIMQCKFSFHGKQWSNVSKGAKDFIISLLQMDPSDRPRAEEALKSNWMKKQFPPGAPNPKLQPSDRLDARQRLHEYGKETKLKRLALLFLAHKSTTSEIAKMRELFEEVSKCMLS